MTITVKAAPPSTCPCRHCQTAPTHQEIVNGWMVTHCARCGDNPIFVRDTDPLNENIELCSPCTQDLAQQFRNQEAK